jgi:hypothetical protein
MTNRKKTLVFMSNKVIKQYGLRGCSVGITDGSDL